MKSSPESPTVAPARPSPSQTRQLRVALTIAGFDPSSGAGVTADLKTFSAHGVYGVACISALTVQSTLGVRSVKNLSPHLVGETLDCLAEDIAIDGVKIGMLGGRGVVAEVNRYLKHFGRREASSRRDLVVLDPVLRSSSGVSLMDPGGIRLLKEVLLARIGWITPNLMELGELTGLQAIQRSQVPEAARKLQESAGRLGNNELNVVVTGGHLDPPDDFLLTASGEEAWFAGERIATRSTHGTGCAFSSALLCRLISGDRPAQAAAAAKGYVAAALRAAYPVGGGHGPLNHLFPLERR